MSLPWWDLRKILELPLVYNLFQKAVGADKVRRHFIEEYVAPLAGGRVLEVGCGPGTNCTWFPENIEYVGCDIDKKYIAYAKQRYGGSKSEFYATPVGNLRELGLKPFNAVIALAVLHHLNDSEVHTLCDEVVELLKPGGLFVTLDPCFTTEQSRVERYITSCDRGRYVRFPKDYSVLLKKRFPQVRYEMKRGKLLFIQQQGIIMIAISGKQ